MTQTTMERPTQYNTLKTNRFLNALKTAKDTKEAAIKAGYSPATAQSGFPHQKLRKLLPKSFEDIRQELILKLTKTSNKFLKQGDNTNYLRAQELISKIQGLQREISEVHHHNHTPEETAELEKLRNNIHNKDLEQLEQKDQLIENQHTQTIDNKEDMETQKTQAVDTQ